MIAWKIDFEKEKNMVATPRRSVYRATRLSRLPALLGAASLTVGFGLALASSSGASPSAGTHTQVRIYRAFQTSGAPAINVTKTVRGSCWEGSAASDRGDAWRCMSGNFIYDPCFSSTRARGIVLCLATGPWSSAAIEIRLTRSLPRKYGNQGKPSTAGLPWALVTTLGWKCVLATGATTVIDRRRANYSCSHTKNWLWGAPMRTHEPWKIYAASVSTRTLSRTVSIKTAWF